MSLIKKFREISKNDVVLAGGKGASLGEMTQAGLNIPDGFIVSSQAFDEFLKETDINIEIDAILKTVDINAIHTVDDASEKIQALILNAKMPEKIKVEIESFYNNLGAKYVAVRSSATSEDGVEAAWAGQLDSYLNTTKDSLFRNIQKCWASLFTPRAIFYRFEKKLNDEQISVAVVVQKMVKSNISGVAFSVHPVTEDRNQLIIEASFGLGEAIVSGQVTPDSYVVKKDSGEIIDKNIFTQEKGLFRKENGGNEWKDILKETAEKQVLTDEDINKLAEIIINIEEHYGFPCDIEWAIEDGEIYITQSRPITTLKTSQDDKKLKLIKVVTRAAPLIAIEPWYKGMVEELSSFFNIPKYETILVFKEGAFERYVPENFLKEVPPQIAEWVKENKDLLKGPVDYQIRAVVYAKEISSREYNDKDIIIEEILKFSKIWQKGFVGLVVTYLFFLWQDVFKEKGTILFDEDILDKAKEWREKADTFFDDGIEALDHLMESLSKITQIKLDVLRLCTFSELQKLIKDNVDKDIFNIIIKRQAESFVFVENKVINEKEAEKYFTDNGYFIPTIKSNDDIKGNVANSGVASGTVRIVFNKKQLQSVKDGDILVAPMTTPWYLPAMKKAGAIVTDEGGVTCHAAIVSRELNKPCVIGTKNATDILHDGMKVEVDANQGIVSILNKN